jgi:hypothetical protein
MSSRRVLGAAAALREFTIDQVGVFCDEEPQDIVRILEQAGDRLRRIPADPADPPEADRWLVVDLAGLRRDLALTDQGPTESLPTRRALDAHEATTTRLDLAEESLAECASEPTAAGRRILVSTAQNHLRQVVAQAFDRRTSWWSLELSPETVRAELQEHPAPSTGPRLELDVAMAQLAECDATGHRVSMHELLRTVARVEQLAPLLDELRLAPLVERFVDLVTGQVSVGAALAAPQRLITALTRRRARARVGQGLGQAIHDLFPILRSLADDENHQQLYTLLDQRPDGRHHVVVYVDLLALLPRHLQCSTGPERLSGTLVEAVTEPAASTRLNGYARELAHDLVESSFRNDKSLIGATMQVFQKLAERDGVQDETMQARCDNTRHELFNLATISSWSPATGPTELHR